ncbi:hypothetical protein BC937DRAFT_94446 [Endogone sp. FLAS-F59071]|nr:hypothetical protein BC937DRAFT_94446 [Endogone sp. FLAS-F59071]|eukprot:RUS20762.1 hypothetical protein BC937DRAFT_94446 [Endogone sp. FLAS-F59071]
MMPQQKGSAICWIRVLFLCVFLYRAMAVAPSSGETTLIATLSTGSPIGSFSLRAKKLSPVEKKKKKKRADYNVISRIVPTTVPECPNARLVDCPAIVSTCPANCPTCYLNGERISVLSPLLILGGKHPYSHYAWHFVGTIYCPTSIVSSNNPTSSLNSVSSISTTTSLGSCVSIYPCNITVGATYCPPECNGSCFYNQTTPCCPNQKLGTCVNPTNGTSIAIVTTGGSLTSTVSTFVAGPTSSGAGQTSGVQARYVWCKGWILVGVVAIGMMEW